MPLTQAQKKEAKQARREDLTAKYAAKAKAKQEKEDAEKAKVVERKKAEVREKELAKEAQSIASQSGMDPVDKKKALEALDKNPVYLAAKALQKNDPNALQGAVKTLLEGDAFTGAAEASIHTAVKGLSTPLGKHPGMKENAGALNSKAPYETLSREVNDILGQIHEKQTHFISLQGAVAKFIADYNEAVTSSESNKWDVLSKKWFGVDLQDGKQFLNAKVVEADKEGADEIVRFVADFVRKQALGSVDLDISVTELLDKDHSAKDAINKTEFDMKAVQLQTPEAKTSKIAAQISVKDMLKMAKANVASAKAANEAVGTKVELFNAAKDEYVAAKAGALKAEVAEEILGAAHGIEAALGDQQNVLQTLQSNGQGAEAKLLALDCAAKNMIDQVGQFDEAAASLFTNYQKLHGMLNTAKQALDTLSAKLDAQPTASDAAAVDTSGLETQKAEKEVAKNQKQEAWDKDKQEIDAEITALETQKAEKEAALNAAKEQKSDAAKVQNWAEVSKSGEKETALGEEIKVLTQQLEKAKSEKDGKLTALEFLHKGGIGKLNIEITDLDNQIAEAKLADVASSTTVLPDVSEALDKVNKAVAPFREDKTVKKGGVVGIGSKKVDAQNLLSGNCVKLEYENPGKKKAHSETTGTKVKKLVDTVSRFFDGLEELALSEGDYVQWKQGLSDNVPGKLDATSTNLDTMEGMVTQLAGATSLVDGGGDVVKELG